MQNLKNKTMAILIAAILTFSMTASMVLIPSASAHTPPWNIPTQAYIVAEPNPIGVGQTIQVYMWLTEVYGAAGGTTAAFGTNGYTASSALLSNDYRFENYKLTVTAPNGAVTTTSFPVVSDPTSDQETSFTPSQVGTYNFTFNYAGQVYGANGDGYSGSVLINDTYLPSSASTTLTVQSTPIAGSITSEPLPTTYWQEPIYGENNNWWSISSNWLGTGSGPPQGYGGTANAASYRSDAIGPLTSHIMWTSQLQFGGVAEGNQFSAGGSNPNGAVQGAAYYEGSAYQPRFTNPIIIDGTLFYTEPASFTGPGSGPTVAVNLETGQLLWSNPNMPPLSFGYVYSVWDPDQHGVYPPILVANNANSFNGVTGTGYVWQLYDAYTGDSLFNITNIPQSTSYVVPIATLPPSSVTFPNQVVSTNILGPSGEELRYVITNIGTATSPNWYLSEWNMTKLWQYDINPYTGAGSVSPDPVNASNGVMLPTIPIPVLGETGTLPNGLGTLVPDGSSITVNANIPIDDTAFAPGTTTPIGQINYDSLTTYDWNVSLPWLNTMPLPPASVSTVTGQLVQPPAGSNPVSILAVKAGDEMLCRNGSLPTGFGATKMGFPQLPYTYFAVNLNATVGPVGNILWMQTYNPPAGNLTLLQGATDFQTGVFIIYELETMQFLGYSLSTGNYLWTTSPLTSFDYYYDPGQPTPGVVAYGNLYDDGFGGVLYCFNDLTGKLLWTYGNGGEDNSTYAGFNTSYGDYPTQIQSIANGVVYTATDEHTIPDPLYKGAVYSGINATTGQQIWTLSGYPSVWTSSAAVQWATADGFITCMNGYNNQIYSIGRGPSATTVQAPMTAIAAGTNVAIQGTVIDTSTGTQQPQQKADFPNGVPCSSDASMTQWMGYVYQQQAEPTNFTGVTVTLTAIDPNHNFVTLGSATTDSNGLYNLMWQAPTIPGKYTVTATFSGTNGYWGSEAQTTMIVQNAATVSPTASPATGLASTGTVELGIAAVIIVIIIIGAILALLLLRKRP